MNKLILTPLLVCALAIATEAKAPKITEQPTNLKVYRGQTAQFYCGVDFTGRVLESGWQIKVDHEWYWTTDRPQRVYLSSDPRARLRLEKASMDDSNTQYRFVIKTELGSVESDVVTLTVVEPPPGTNIRHERP